MPVKEVITIHCGQAGCGVGLSLWELLCEEHGISPAGTRDVDDDGARTSEDPFNTFFSETAAGQHVPRSIFLDTDPSSKEDALNSKHGKLFHPDNLLAWKQDSRSNFFEGRTACQEYKIKEATMDAIRKEVDKCRSLQGFFFFHSFGGGTGTGVGVEILDALRTQYSKKVIMQPVIFPSQDFAASTVEPYNCMFATAYTRDTADLSMMLDNQAAYRICKESLKVKNPSFLHLNRLMSQVVSAATTSLRFETQLNASLDEIVTNLVPEPSYRYPLMALSPVRHPSRAMHENFSTREIINDLFEEKNLMADIGVGKLKLNRFLSCCVIIRGVDTVRKDDLDGHMAKYKGDGGGKVQVPIQLKEAQSALQELVKPSGSHREKLNFLPWLQGGGFKVGAVAEPPTIPAGFMASSDRQGGLLANTTAVRTLFMRQYSKFLKLFYHKAYVWQFLEANGELEMFFEAQERLRDILSGYEDMLMRSCEGEQQTDSTRVLKGARPRAAAGAGAGAGAPAAPAAPVDMVEG